MPNNKASERLLKACEEHNIPQVLETLQQGANPNIKGEFGAPLTALLMCHALAVGGGRFPNLNSVADLVPGVEALIQAGAKIDARSCEGTSPLFDAVQCYNIPCSLKLVELGANVNAKNRKGHSVLLEAVQRNLEELVEPLLIRGADIVPKTLSGHGNPVISSISVNASVSLIRTLVQYGADVNSDNARCLATAVRYMAAKFQNFTVVDELIRLGANVNSVNSYQNETRLMQLAKFPFGEEDLNEAKTWIALGADLSLKNSSGQTALDIALARESEALDIGLVDKKSTAMVEILRSPELISPHQVE